MRILSTEVSARSYFQAGSNIEMAIVRADKHGRHELKGSLKTHREENVTTRVICGALDALSFPLYEFSYLGRSFLSILIPKWLLVTIRSIRRNL